MSGPVLIAYDGSDGAAQAIAEAGRLLAPRRALVVNAFMGLSHMILRSNVAVRDLRGPLADAVDEFDSADAEEAERVAAEGAQLAIAAGLEAQPITVKQEGKAWEALIATALEHRAAVIVAGSRGRSGLAEILLGSVARGLAGHSPVPVLIVRGETLGRGPVLLGYDSSDEAACAVRAAGELLAERAALIVNVWHSWVVQVPPYLPGVAREFDEVVQQLSGEYVAEGLDLGARAGFDVEGLSVRALRTAWHTLLQTADDRDAQVIVVGARSVGPPLAFLGGTADGVVHHSARPVLVVPPTA